MQSASSKLVAEYGTNKSSAGTNLDTQRCKIES